MLSWFTENSLVPMITGFLLAGAFLGLAFSFRDKLMLLIALVIGVLTLVTVVTETLIVTDKEAVRETVFKLARTVAANDVDAVIDQISESRTSTIADVRHEMPQFKFDSVRVIGFNDFTITDGQPKTAKVDFVVWASGSTRRSQDFGNVRRRIILTFQKEPDGQWRMIDYEHSDPARGQNL